VDILHLFGISNGGIANFDEFLLMEMSKSSSINGIWILKLVILNGYSHKLENI
jgi:hypothetical protein